MNVISDTIPKHSVGLPTIVGKCGHQWTNYIEKSIARAVRI